MTSTGKIARLPKYIRDQINQRLDDGQSANEILRWLNQLPECQEMLAQKFGSHPITRQNLSQWKQGGYQTWLRVQQTREQVQSLFEYAEDLETDDSGSPNGDDMTFADRLGALVAVQLLTAIQKLDDITDPDQRWLRLSEIVSQLSRLRREDHHGRRVRLAEEQWSDKCSRQEKQDEIDAKEAKKIELRTWFWSIGELKKDAEFLGGGEFGERWADWLRRLECDLPRPDWWKGPWINHSPARHYDPHPHRRDAQSKHSESAVRQERQSPHRRGPRDSKPKRSLPRNKSNHKARNTEHETLNPSTPDPHPSSTSPSSCKVNQSKSNQQRAKVPEPAGSAGQPNRGSSRRSLSEDGSKSNPPPADVTTEKNPLTPNPQPSSPSDHAARNTEHGTLNSPPPQQIPPLDTRHPPPK